MVIDLLCCQRTHPLYINFRDRHYIPNRGCHGQQLHYLVLLDGMIYGVISGASAVYAVGARDRFFGLSPNADKKRIQLSSLINNVVFRIENAPPNAATQVLALWRRRIARDWEYLYQVKVAGFETFVIEADIADGRRRLGTLYQADNWAMLGLTAGSTKNHSSNEGSGGMNAAHTRRQVCQKLIYARKVKNIELASSYSPTWQDPVAQRAVQRRRKELFAIDAAALARLEQPNAL